MQEIEAETLEYDPGGHSAQELEPTEDEKLPIGQSLQVAELVAPKASENFPVEHKLQEVEALLTLYDPNGHAKQEPELGE
jgi:hypothetical protein